jgi:hypothetical protein
MVKLKFFSIKSTERIIPEMSKILSEAPVKPAKILNPFSSQNFFFFDLALLNSPNKTPAKLLNNQ